MFADEIKASKISIMKIIRGLKNLIFLSTPHNKERLETSIRLSLGFPKTP